MIRHVLRIIDYLVDGRMIDQCSYGWMDDDDGWMMMEGW